MTADITTVGSITMGRKGEKEVIHSGHFMVSDFEADAQDDEENVLLEIPGDIMEESVGPSEQGRIRHQQEQGVITYAKKSSRAKMETLSIDSSLTKLFNAMSIAYRYDNTAGSSCFYYHTTTIATAPLLGTTNANTTTTTSWLVFPLHFLIPLSSLLLSLSLAFNTVAIHMACYYYYYYYYYIFLSF
ncbi:hypothetical protein E2C01_085725 [Portunus trituberculatus]|uniref:Uncharacterized protein n=1 Tax=Portunus trituberculatus TaxID=210409 RepID=A0A5B7JCP9_PORTR|nr:hypothetical protein [Portunus trituberculatus]